jgi:hypothetical protein
MKDIFKFNKNINILLRKKFKENNSLKCKMLLLYLTITEINSDLKGGKIKNYTKIISEYSGLSKEFIPKGVKHLKDLEIITIDEDRDGGKIVEKSISLR